MCWPEPGCFCLSRSREWLSGGGPLFPVVSLEMWHQSHHVLYRVQFLSLGAVGAVSPPCLDSSCESPGALGALAAGCCLGAVVAQGPHVR